MSQAAGPAIRIPTNGQLAGLARTSLRQQALEALRRAVTSGEIAPGTHLVETELSEALSISRGTLREALRQLQQEGLAVADERGRLSVRALDDVEITQIFQVRATLEGLAAELLAGQADRSTALTRLSAALDNLASSTGSIYDMVETDLAFHRTMCELTGNSTLVHTWDTLSGSIRMSIMFAGAERAIRNMAVSRHREIIDAIAAGDPDQARRAVVEHMRSATTTLTSRS
jgi:DNA-binding GntR family transcriptional regulator